MAGRVAGYVRVSTREQADAGVSLDAQRAAMRAYCTMRGLDLAEVVVDAGVSAGKPLASREGGGRVLELVNTGDINGVVAFKLDRLFRDCADCLDVVRQWDEREVALHLIDLGGQTIDTSSAMGRFFLTVMAGAAELERNLIGERTSAALSHLKKRGVKVGRVGFGWKRTEETDAEGRRVVSRASSDAETIAIVCKLREQGLSLRAICAELTAANRRTKRGGAWRPKVVRSILLRVDAQAPTEAA